MNGRKNACVNGRTDSWIDGWMDGRMDGRLDYGWMDDWMDVSMSETLFNHCILSTTVCNKPCSSYAYMVQ